MDGMLRQQDAASLLRLAPQLPAQLHKIHKSNLLRKRVLQKKSNNHQNGMAAPTGQTQLCAASVSSSPRTPEAAGICRAVPQAAPFTNISNISTAIGLLRIS